MSIERFVRFVDEKGEIVFGEPSSSDVKGKLEGKSVTLLSGDPFQGFSKTTSTATITKVLSSPLIDMSFYMILTTPF